MKRLPIYLSIILAVILIAEVSSADVWQKDIFDSTGTSTGVNCAIALDSDGYPHISYANTEDLYLYYAHYDGNNWDIQTVDSFGITGLHTSIALDSMDRPHISYSAHIMDLRHVFRNDTGWVNQFVDSGLNPGMQGFRTSIALDYKDNPHIAYFNDDSGWVVYASYDSDDWSTEYIQDITGSAYLKLILKNDSIPYIGYHIFDEDVTSDTLRIAYKTTPSGEWQFETMPEPICAAGIFFQSFDMDSEGNCYFAYQTPFMPGVPLPCTADISPFRTIAKFNGSGWTTEVVPNPTGDPYEIYYTFPLFLKFDRNDNPAFLADTILYWKKDGVNWSYYGLGNQMGDETAVFQQLIFDEYNYPNMVFGQPWAVYYKLYPGDPQINVPVTSHTYTANYSTWNCLIENLGEAPVLIDSLKYKKTDSTFQIIYDKTPFYIHSGLSDSISIRFMPEAAITYYDTLLIYSNDSLNLIVNVALEGTGDFDPTTGDLAIFTFNCYAAPEYHSINYELPLSGVSIALYQSNVLMYGPIVSDFVGLALQADIIPGTYNLRMEKTVDMPGDDKANHTLQHSITIEIDTGLTTDTLILPESLMVQSYQWVYDNSHIEDGDETFIYGANASGTGSIPNLLDIWSSNLDSNKIESAARLILAQEMVDRVFNTGRSLGKKSFEGISDLLHFSIKATDSEGGWALKILKILKIIWDLWAGDKAAALMELMQMLAEYLVIYMIDCAIDEVSAQLPCVEDPSSGFEIICTGDVLKAVWKDIKYNYSNWSLPEANDQAELEDSWDNLNNLVYRRARVLFIQYLYITLLTNPKLEKAQDRSESFNFTSDFEDASETGADAVTLMKVTADNINDAANGMMVTADLLMKTYIAMTLASGFLPSVSILEDIKTVTMYAALGLDIAATGVSLGGFFNIPFDMDDAVDAIYFPDAKSNSPPGLKRAVENLPKAKANYQVMTMLKQRIQNSVTTYDSVLNVVREHIQGDSIESAMFATGNLALADVNLMRTVNVSMAPAYAIAHAMYDSLPGFNKLYDGMVSNGTFAGMTRYFNYLSLVQLPADSSIEMKDYLVTHLDTASYYNHTWTDGTLELLDSIFGLEIPGIVVASEASQNKYGLELTEDTATITIVLQNVGAVTADDISIIFETNAGLMMTNRADSVYVGSLAPGEESGVYKWTVVVSDTAYPKGFWEARVVSSNAKTYSPDGSMVAKINAPLGVDDMGDGLILPENFKLNQNHPNPFNPSTTIEYSLSRRTDVKLSVFNILGRKVTTLVNENQAAGPHAVSWSGTDTDGEPVASGIYFYRLEADDIIETRKMVLLK
ncbi:MAG: FlgD immunoglobulin-like domain containing protein [Candidatus Zixiibacteriota bacterium]